MDESLRKFDTSSVRQGGGSGEWRVPRKGAKEVEDVNAHESRQRRLGKKKKR